MISKYRTKGFIQLACAVATSALLVYLFLRRDGQHSSDNYSILLIFLYLGSWTMWMISSFTLAKAKGYAGVMAGGILLFLILLGFCFPVAAFVFPAVALFGLKDKTKEKRW
jgi:hypothetical protein